MAAKAGVSRQTVSNALNTPRIVHPATLERVMEAVAELGYSPNLHARRLRTSSARTIGVRLEPVHDGIHGVLLDRFLHAVTEQAADLDRHVLVFTADGPDDEVARIRSLSQRSLADAFILTSTDHRDARVAALVEAGIPFVAFGRSWDADGPDHAWVDVDGRAGTREATEACLAVGERVAFLGWPTGSGAGDERRAGWREAMDVAGLATDLDRAVTDDPGEAQEAASELLAAGATAIVCASDTLALGAIGALARADASVPVVGFDDTGVAAGLGFSSVDQSLGDVAAAVLSLLHGDADHRLVTPRLHRRAHPRWGLPAQRTASADGKEAS
ncbi:LacI family DNA-binding transcriptional regulator [Agrococcus sp. SGAir0287]|uniref:LacI family DNA-binding transcriptional regulator n=1 Tax=Agrococcus sp. SGAir0287 TaxID=2070347 RepID=UPI0015865568|nr:LacI family DNA-binding transcriptional regulator [Agrococcus sp. SGAir0287]